MIRKAVRFLAPVLLCLVSILVYHSAIFGSEDPEFPRLANCFLPHSLYEREVEPLSRFDLLVIEKKLDETERQRGFVDTIKELNPDIILLMYVQSANANPNENPNSPIADACEEYDWWLRDYQGNILDYENFPSILINMTNMDAASGSHPNGVKPNQFLAEWTINEHIALYSHWDGIFYDTFADNLSWMHPDVKDANRNGIPEYDRDTNGDEPVFSNIWSQGALTLLDNTRALAEDIIIIGNGLHRGALDGLNGKFQESFRPSSSKNIHYFCTNHKYLVDGSRTPKVCIINGSLSGPNLTDYDLMRFTLCATLMTDNYYSIDYGSHYHSEIIWYDEFSVKDDGSVNASITNLSQSVDAEQATIPVSSTDGFASSGVLQIDGEQVYYGSKDANQFLDCYRGFTRRSKYDLRASHADGSQVIQHYASFTHYLGKANGPSFDVNDPAVKLDDLLEAAGWSADEDEAENIDSRVWRRDFENGIALVNPTDETRVVSGLGQNLYKKISGIQDPQHNDGGLVSGTLSISPKDGYILLNTSDSDTTPPAPPEGLRIRP